MDINEKCRKLPILKQQEQYKYDEEIKSWIKMFYDFELADGNYPENIQQIQNKPIHELTRDEVLTKITFMLRSDHFGNRNFESAVKDGTLELLCIQLHVVTMEL